jgi:hypothetical protein
MEKKKVNVRLELQGERLEQFSAIKKHYGVVRNTEVLHLLIASKFQDIQRQASLEMRRIPVDPETYARLEAKAKKKGMTVDEYASTLTGKIVERSKQK